MIATTALRSILLPVALVGAIGGFVAGCGDSEDESGKVTETQTTPVAEPTADELGEKGAEIQESAENIQKEAQEIGDDVTSGKISPKEGRKLLREKAEELQKQAEAAGAEAFGDSAK